MRIESVISENLKNLADVRLEIKVIFKDGILADVIVENKHLIKELFRTRF